MVYLDFMFYGPLDEVEHTPVSREIVVAPIIAVGFGGTRWQVHVFLKIRLGQLHFIVI